MKQSIKDLRIAYDKYMTAKQVRYDELVAECPSPDGMEAHKYAVDRINIEQSALPYREDYATTTGPMISDDDMIIWPEYS